MNSCIFNDNHDTTIMLHDKYMTNTTGAFGKELINKDISKMVVLPQTPVSVGIQCADKDYIEMVKEYEKSRFLVSPSAR